MKANWITFYSYKGGVGRSMALANVAANLAMKGRKVVLIDFDLEAPGLDSFQEFDHKGAAGVVEYVDAFLQTKITPPIEQFVHRCPLRPEVEGEIWLMPSGRKDSAYAEKLHQTDWNALYGRGIAQPFIANWKAAIERAFKPDYVFIDSRTGLTDIGGVCTLHFPDIVVLLFALNRQNLAGTAGVLRAITGVQDREPIQVITVASPVPNIARDGSNPLAERFQEAQRILSSQINAVIGYFPSVALEERLWTLDTSFPLPQIAEDYKTLTDQILRRIHDGFDFLLSRAAEVIRLSDESAVQQVIDALLAGYSERAETFRTIAKLERIRNNRDASLNALEKALVIDPSDQDALTSVSTQYRLLGKFPDLHQLIDGVATRISGQSAGRYYHNWFILGEHFMMFKEHRKAVEAYEMALKCDFPGKIMLAVWFNVAEARRRATGVITPADWMIVLSYLEKNPIEPTSGNDSNLAGVVANRFQAMHVAYAAAGNIAKAEEFLDRAIAVAATLNPTAYLFSLATYTSVSPGEFIQATMTMRAALSNGRLWDGMPLK